MSYSILPIIRIICGAKVESAFSPCHSQSSSVSITNSPSIIHRHTHRTQIPITNFLSPTSSSFVPRQFRVSQVDPHVGQFSPDEISSMIQLHTLLGFPDNNPKAPPFSKLVPVKKINRRRHRISKKPIHSDNNNNNDNNNDNNNSNDNTNDNNNNNNNDNNVNNANEKSVTSSDSSSYNFTSPPPLAPRSGDDASTASSSSKSSSILPKLVDRSDDNSDDSTNSIEDLNASSIPTEININNLEVNETVNFDGTNLPPALDADDGFKIGRSLINPKREGIIRLSGCNPNGIKYSDLKNHLQYFMDLDIDIQCYSEVNANFQRPKLRNKFYEHCQSMDRNSNSVWGTSDSSSVTAISNQEELASSLEVQQRNESKGQVMIN